MRPVLAVHILAGALALIAGFIALFAAKGARGDAQRETILIRSQE